MIFFVFYSVRTKWRNKKKYGIVKYCVKVSANDCWCVSICLDLDLLLGASFTVGCTVLRLMSAQWHRMQLSRPLPVSYCVMVHIKKRRSRLVNESCSCNVISGIDKQFVENADETGPLLAVCAARGQRLTWYSTRRLLAWAAAGEAAPNTGGFGCTTYCYRSEAAGICRSRFAIYSSGFFSRNVNQLLNERASDSVCIGCPHQPTASINLCRGTGQSINWINIWLFTVENL